MNGGEPPQCGFTLCFGEELSNTEDPSGKLIIAQVQASHHPFCSLSGCASKNIHVDSKPPTQWAGVWSDHRIGSLERFNSQGLVIPLDAQGQANDKRFVLGVNLDITLPDSMQTRGFLPHWGAHVSKKAILMLT